jgi:hypothetical protein
MSRAREGPMASNRNRGRGRQRRRQHCVQLKPSSLVAIKLIRHAIAPAGRLFLLVGSQLKPS